MSRLERNKRREEMRVQAHFSGDTTQPMPALSPPAPPVASRLSPTAADWLPPQQLPPPQHAPLDGALPVWPHVPPLPTDGAPPPLMGGMPPLPTGGAPPPLMGGVPPLPTGGAPPTWMEPPRKRADAARRIQANWRRGREFDARPPPMVGDAWLLEERAKMWQSLKQFKQNGWCSPVTVNMYVGAVVSRDGVIATMII